MLRIKTYLGEYKVNTLYEPWSQKWITIASKSGKNLTSFLTKNLEAAGKQHLSICVTFKEALDNLKAAQETKPTSITQKVEPTL